jgi:hypothetical protein
MHPHPGTLSATSLTAPSTHRPRFLCGCISAAATKQQLVMASAVPADSPIVGRVIYLFCFSLGELLCPAPHQKTSLKSVDCVSKYSEPWRPVDVQTYSCGQLLTMHAQAPGR